MLGSTFTSEMTSWSFSYSAQCLVRQWLREMTSWIFFVFSAMLGSTLDTWCCQSTWPFHRCSSWTRLFCPDPEVHHSGGAAVAVSLQGHQHPCPCAETASHGLTFQRPWRFSCCSTLTRRLMLVVHVRQALWCPQLQRRCWTLLFTCLSLRNDRYRGWSRQCSKLWRLRSWRSSTGLAF